MAGRVLNPNSDAWGGAWGSASAWGGTWGWSWSPLHEVDEAWDTDQGLARSNIKFTPIRDVSVRVTTTRCKAVSSAARQVWGSSVARRQVSRINTGCSIPTSGVQANAFTRPSKHNCFVSCTGAPSFGWASARASVLPCLVGVKGSSSSAGATAVAFTAELLSGGSEQAVALGVRNPSDEELAVLITSLVTKRTTKQLNKHVRSDIKPT